MIRQLAVLRSRTLSQANCNILFKKLAVPYSTKSFEQHGQDGAFDDHNPLAQEAEKLLTEHLSVHSDNARRALELLKDAVLQGSPRAKTLLGSMFREGFVVKEDREEALRLFSEAAEQGDPAAQCSLGALKLQGVKEKSVQGMHDSVTQTDFAVDVNEQGEARGMLRIETKDGPVSDAPKPAELVRRVRKARRKAGFTDEQALEFEEFKKQKQKEALEKERRDAISWLEQAARQGNDEALVVLGNEVLRDDPNRAVELYEAAVKNGHNVDAYYNLGQIYTRGLGNIQPDEKAAFKNFAMAAQLGDPSAQFYLGHLYRVGSKEVKVDLASSRQYIEMAAAQEHPGALYYLALMHRDGEGGLENSKGAFLRYVQMAASLDHGPAHVCLAELHYTGYDGVDVDYEKALKHFLAAGHLGEADAFCSAAAMYYHGFGAEEDHHEAFLLYQKAAELGSAQALRNIGSMYYHGHGVPPNKKLAEHFFRAADDRDAEIQRSDELHMQTPVETAEAPKHPMADVPRPRKESEDSLS